jgi:hypothetical protein
MLKEELIKRSPIRILEKSIQGGLGVGNLGVFTARKGVGKTACLVHVSTDYLLRGQKVLHLSFADDPHHIENWYKHVFREVASAYKLENTLDNYDQIIKNRLIINFKQRDAVYERIQKTIDAIAGGSEFVPRCLIIDGFSFYDHGEEEFRLWKAMAGERDVEVWFSATLHREELKLDARGIPAPVNRFYDLFSVIIMLQPKPNYIDLKLLKDHDARDLEKLRLKLDPTTLLIANHRV